jgi:hypothetical protein
MMADVDVDDVVEVEEVPGGMGTDTVGKDVVNDDDDDDNEDDDEDNDDDGGTAVVGVPDKEPGADIGIFAFVVID